VGNAGDPGNGVGPLLHERVTNTALGGTAATASGPASARASPGWACQTSRSMAGQDLGAGRRERLAAARLYMVFDSAPRRHELPDLLRAAAAGGVDIVQLRDKQLSDDELVSVADASRALCEVLGLLLVVNDRPFVAGRQAPTACTSARTTPGGPGA